MPFLIKFLEIKEEKNVGMSKGKDSVTVFTVDSKKICEIFIPQTLMSYIRIPLIVLPISLSQKKVLNNPSAVAKWAWHQAYSTNIEWVAGRAAVKGMSL